MKHDPTRLVSSLNDEQRDAVTTNHPGHLLVLAGAGCGKTSVLTRRIAYLIATGVTQDRILAVTFTRAAAEEMLSRVMSYEVIDTALPVPELTTFHAFCLRFLQRSILGIPNYVRAGFSQPPVLMSEQERVGALAELLRKEALGADASEVLQVDAALARRHVKRGEHDVLSGDYQTMLNKIDQVFTRLKRETNRWTFSDMVTSAVNILESDPKIAEICSQWYEHILVDEFQDTNPLQVRLLNLLLGQDTRLFAVGDDDQAIYGFRGADIGPIRNFTTAFPGSRICKLQINYRSTPAILGSANRIFRDKPALYRKVLVSGRFQSTKADRGTVPRKVRCPDDAQMARWVRERIDSLASQERIPVDQMAVLCRTNARLQAVQEAIRSVPSSKGVPQFLTIHRAKGLEFPVVFLCGLEESVFPNYRHSGKPVVRTWGELFAVVTGRIKPKPCDCDLEEERRLFYVGVTRAERFLYLVYVQRGRYLGRTRSFRPSRFLRLL